MNRFTDVIANLKRGRTQRVLAFGSSNTARKLYGLHWFDCLDLAIAHQLGRNHRFINTGIGGNTTGQLLDRFDEDAALFKPHAVFITIGGNDANPARDISLAQFRTNLLELHSRFVQLNCAVIFQTYYAPNTYSASDPGRQALFPQYMQAVRDVAAETDSELIDHLARWEPLRDHYPAYYIQLMRDQMHVNDLGNMVIGLDLARRYDLPLGLEAQEQWSFPKQCQALMDSLEANPKGS